jgi:hypothetical protein
MHTYSNVPKHLHILEGADSSAHWLQPYHLGQLLLVKTTGRDPQAIIELITHWVLRGRFYLIAAGEWLPHHDDLRYSIYKYTSAIDDALENLVLARPFTCYQLLDLLMEADRLNRPVLILDYLHLFYDPNVDLSLRDTVLEKCCHYVRRLSFSNPVVLLVQDVVGDEYERFFPLVAAMADNIIESDKNPSSQASQIALF